MYANGASISKQVARPAAINGRRTGDMQPSSQYAAPGNVSPQRPGQARPVPPQSQGTPYLAHSPFSQNNASFSQRISPQSQQVTGNPMGGLAAASPANRPPPFRMGLASTPWGMSADPFAERDALIQRLAAQRMQNQIAFNSGGPVNPVAGMMPWQNMQQAMQEAGLAGGAPSMQPGYGGPNAFPYGSPVTNKEVATRQPAGGYGAPEEGFRAWLDKQFSRPLQGGQALPQEWKRPQIGYSLSELPPGVSSLPWQNDPSMPLPPGWTWERAAAGSRSEGWMPKRTGAAAPGGIAPQPAGGAPSMQPGYGGGFVGAANSWPGSSNLYPGFPSNQYPSSSNQSAGRAAWIY